MKKITSFYLVAMVILMVSVIGIGANAHDSNLVSKAGSETYSSEPHVAPTFLPLRIPALTPSSFDQYSGGFSFTAIDVGKGDALLLSWPDLYVGTHYMLIDGGTADDWPFVHDYLVEHNITGLDAIVCSHEHDDHLNGLIELLKSNITVGTAYDAGFLVCHEDWPEYPKIQEYLGLLEERNIPREIVGAGDELWTANPAVTIRVINPDPQHLIISQSKNDAQNANSIALDVNYNGARFLLMGDTFPSSFQQMMNEGYIQQADVLKMPHHGFMPAAASVYDEFLATVRPKYAIDTCGCYRPDNESMWQCQISPALTMAGLTTYRSACSGDITITTDGKTSADGIHYAVTTTKNLTLRACSSECESSCTAE